MVFVERFYVLRSSVNLLKAFRVVLLFTETFLTNWGTSIWNGFKVIASYAL